MPRDDRGGAAVELAILLPLLLLLAAGIWPLLAGIATYADVDHAAADGIRYATKVDRNPIANACATETGLSGSRRRSNAEVVAYVSDAVELPGATVTVTVDHASGSLCRATSGTPVTVTVSYPLTTGTLARTANTIAGFFGGGPIYTDTTRSTSAYGLLE